MFYQFQLQKLAETGEESLMLITDVDDGSKSLLASAKGLDFLQNKRAATMDIVSACLKEFSEYLGSPLRISLNMIT